MCSAISLAGVIGYAAKNRQPAAIAPSAMATSPYQKCLPVKTAFPIGSPPLVGLLSFLQPIWRIPDILFHKNRKRHRTFPSPVPPQPLGGDNLFRSLSWTLGAPLWGKAQCTNDIVYIALQLCESLLEKFLPFESAESGRLVAFLSPWIIFPKDSGLISDIKVYKRKGLPHTRHLLCRDDQLNRSNQADDDLAFHVTKR